MTASKYDVKRLEQAKHIEWIPLNDGYYGYWTTSTYGGVEQKWLLVRSTKAKAREEHILNKAIAKRTEAALKSFHRLCRKTFACAADAGAALEEWKSSQEFTVVCDTEVIEGRKYTNGNDLLLNDLCQCRTPYQEDLTR